MDYKFVENPSRSGNNGILVQIPEVGMLDCMNILYCHHASGDGGKFE